MFKFLRRKRGRIDLEKYQEALRRSIDFRYHDDEATARDFRKLFYGDEETGKRVAFMLLEWCGHHDASPPPIEDAELQRWAGKYEIGQKIIAALIAPVHIEPEPSDLNQPPVPDEL